MMFLVFSQVIIQLQTGMHIQDHPSRSMHGLLFLGRENDANLQET